MDTLIHGLAADGTIRCMAAVTTNIVREATKRHKTSPIVSIAFGRTLTGTILFGSSLKELDRLTVKIEGDGEIEGIVAEATAKGTVRGYVKNPDAIALDVKSVVGKGMFYVMRESGFDLGLYQEPYRGSVPLLSGEIGEDFAYYFAKSEQIPSAVLLGVKLQAEEPFVVSAGGVMLQIMPDANQDILTMIEDTISYAPSISDLIKSGATPAELLENVLGIVPFEVLEEKPISFACTCSPERAISIIEMLDKNELIDMLETDKGAAMDCHFCNEHYAFDEARLSEIIGSKTY
jgi:molecular chaperone Hsp33